MLELFGTKILPFLGAGPSWDRHDPPTRGPRNKTGTSRQGVLYVDNRGIVRLAAAGERIGSVQGGPKAFKTMPEPERTAEVWPIQ